MLDPERQPKYGNDYSVNFPDYPSFTSQPRKITLTQAMGSHDVAVFKYQYFSNFLVQTFKTGTPVSFTYRNDKVNKTFIGYFSHVQYPSAQTLDRHVELVCIGASYPLKETISKIWVNTSASQVVTEIAKQAQLTPMVTSSNVKFSQISMVGHTFWEKIKELADKIGYGVQVLGTEVHFHPIDTMIDLFMTTIPVMSFLDPLTNSSSVFSVPTLQSFSSKLGDYIQGNANNRTHKVVSGVDPVTGKAYSSKSSPHTVGKPLRANTKAPLFSRVETSVVAHSDSMVKALADGKAHLSRLSIPGKGSGQGDPRVSPWSTIEIRNTGDNSDGFWIVKTAVHEMTLDGKYFVDFTCATDGFGANQPSISRPATAGVVPAVNLNSLVTGSNPSGSYTLSATTPIVSPTSTGYNITPRRWVGTSIG